MSLINDALKKAQQKRAEDAAAQTAPPLPPAHISQGAPPEPVSAPPPAPPPAAPRTEKPVLPRRNPGTTPLIVNYSIPQIELNEQPATPKPTARTSSIRYNPSADGDDVPRSPKTGGQKTFWIVLGCIAAIAIIVRLAVTTGRQDERQAASPTEPHLTPKPADTRAVPKEKPPVIVRQESKPEAKPAAPAANTVTASPEPTVAIVLPTPERTPSATATPPPVVATPPVVVAKTAQASPPPVVPTPVVPAPPSEPAPTVTLPSMAKTAATPPAATVLPASPPAATVLPPIYAPRAPTPVDNATRIQGFIERLRVTGVRISERGNKVILNDRLFSTGDTVNPGLELKLTKIEPGVITFTDSSGRNYIKLYQ